MKTLWAPWRMEYILSDKTHGCIFCELPKQDKDRENLILYRSSHNFVIMNRYPYNNGHLMVVPSLHMVPRWAGDTSFMTVFGEVRVVPEHIMGTYDKLFVAFNS